MASVSQAVEPGPAKSTEELATSVRDIFQSRGLSLAAMESFTGGLLASTLTDVPHSGYLLAAVVAYDSGVKTRFGVPPDVIDTHGVVSAETAEAMARSAATFFGTSVGIATTGAAGPDPQEGEAPGTMFISVALRPDRVHTRELESPRDRKDVKAVAVHAALELLLETATGRGN